MDEHDPYLDPEEEYRLSPTQTAWTWVFILILFTLAGYGLGQLIINVYEYLLP